MIDKTDIILLLSDMQKNNIDVSNDVKAVLNSDIIPLNIIKKINEFKSIDIINFYIKLKMISILNYIKTL